MVSLSCETNPSIEPEPYWMEKSEPLALCEDDDPDSYFAWRKHAMEVQPLLGTQRLLELQGTWVKNEQE